MHISGIYSTSTDITFIPFIRPLLSAINRSVSLFVRKCSSTTNETTRSAARYAATVNTGLEESAKSEIWDKLHVDAQVDTGKVLFTSNSSLSELLKLRTINNLFVVMFDEKLNNEDIPTDANTLEQLLFKIGEKCDWRVGLEKWKEMSNFDCEIDTILTKNINNRDKQPNFRISSKRFGLDHKFTSPEICSIFGHVVDTKYGWPIRLKNSDLDIYVNFIENHVCVNITLSPKCLSYRNIKWTGMTTLKASTCYAMLRKANIQTGDIVLDPMAGSGAIPVECCSTWMDNELFAYSVGGEISRKSLRRCQVNMTTFEERRPPFDFLRLNVTRMPFCDNSIDVIVSDLPFGQRHGSKELNQTLYPALFRDMARVSRRGTGRAVLLTHDYKNMIEAYKKNLHLWLEQSNDFVKIGNLECFIYLFVRNDTEFVDDGR